MDLSFSRLIATDEAPLPAAEKALLAAALASPAADAAADPLLAPTSGAFNADMAASLTDWAKR